MTKQFDDTNRWNLFRNTEKKNEKSPDFGGSINIDGVEYHLNGWIQTNKAGGRFFSGSVRPKQTAPADATTVDQDVPFN